MATPKMFVDGDLLAFPSAAVAEERIYMAKTPDGKTVAEFNSAAGYKNWLEGCEVFGFDSEFGYDGDLSDLTREFEIRPKSLKDAQKAFKRTLEEWLSACPEGDVTVYLAPKTGMTNPRHEYALRKPYKGNRDNAHKPHYLKELRHWAFSLPYVKRATKFETDDIVCGMAVRNGENGYVIQNEKDVLGCYNCWVYHPGYHDSPVWSDPNSIGYLEWQGKNMGGLGKLFVLAQGGIIGDTADNYSGLDGAGPKKAWEVLSPFNNKPVTDLAEAALLIARMYKEKYGDHYSYKNKDGCESVASWFDFYVEGIRLAYMLKHRKDYPSEFIDPVRILL